MQCFLGSINFDRPFIKGMTDFVRPLYHLTRGKILEKQTDKTEKVFEKVKAKWPDDLELRISDSIGKYELESDASALGIIETLRQ